jgi:hypothetical protein
VTQLGLDASRELEPRWSQGRAKVSDCLLDSEGSSSRPGPMRRPGGDLEGRYHPARQPACACCLGECLACHQGAAWRAAVPPPAALRAWSAGCGGAAAATSAAASCRLRCTVASDSTGGATAVRMGGGLNAAGGGTAGLGARLMYPM